MDRFVLVARLKPGGRQRAEELLAEHAALGGAELESAVDRHGIFLSETEVVFLFEGEGSRESIRAVFNDPVQSTLHQPLAPALRRTAPSCRRGVLLGALNSEVLVATAR